MTRTTARQLAVQIGFSVAGDPKCAPEAVDAFFDKEYFASLAGETRTLVFYESAHRIEDALADCAVVFGAERPAVLARELTKLFETVLDGTLGELQAKVEADPDQRKGEFVLLVQGAGEDADAKIAEGRRLYAKLCEYLKPSQAAKLAADLSGAPRKALYGGEGG